MRKVFRECVTHIRHLQRRFAKREILVLGDSHVVVFKHWYLMTRFPRTYFHVCSVQGATASGLDNPNSKTQARKQFMDLAATAQFNQIIMMLGEVDTGFVIWYRAKKYGSDIAETLDYAVNRYSQLISQVARYGNVRVISCPLPTIETGSCLGEVANLRKEVDASQEDRTALALQFNKAIQQYCRVQDIEFLSLDEDSLGDNGLVHPGLLNPCRTDHHYNKYRYAKLIARHIEPYLSAS